jgi:hypothetical protein
MTTVWILDSAELPPDSPATDGDVLLRSVGADVVVGRVSGGVAQWYDERVAVELLPAGALDDAEQVGSLRRPREQEALATAARGVQVATDERGG